MSKVKQITVKRYHEKIHPSGIIWLIVIALLGWLISACYTLGYPALSLFFAFFLGYWFTCAKENIYLTQLTETMEVVE